MIVLHYTGRPTCAESIEWLCDPAREVSAHYVVAEDGEIFALVDEDQRAWHAGASEWEGETDINSASIGIEMQNPGAEFGYRPFPEAQMKAVAALCQNITHRFEIKTILGHSDVAPGRKIDPGELFDWQWLADNGVPNIHAK
jgi:N-acetylmuramoyl-L-alanine amidase